VFLHEVSRIDGRDGPPMVNFRLTAREPYDSQQRVGTKSEYLFRCLYLYLQAVLLADKKCSEISSGRLHGNLYRKFPANVPRTGQVDLIFPTNRVLEAWRECQSETAGRSPQNGESSRTYARESHRRTTKKKRPKLLSRNLPSPKQSQPESSARICRP
jgi:hypothetical protein